MFNKKYEKANALIFGVACITDNYIDIDGYSNCKGLKCALKQLAKAVAFYDVDEAKAILEGYEEARRYNGDFQVKNGYGAEYILEYEYMEYANNMYNEDNYNDEYSFIYGDKFNGKKLEEYENDGFCESCKANYYLHIRIVR